MYELFYFFFKKADFHVVAMYMDTKITFDSDLQSLLLAKLQTFWSSEQLLATIPRSFHSDRSYRVQKEPHTSRRIGSAAR